MSVQFKGKYTIFRQDFLYFFLCCSCLYRFCTFCFIIGSEYLIICEFLFNRFIIILFLTVERWQNYRYRFKVIYTMKWAIKIFTSLLILKLKYVHWSAALLIHIDILRIFLLKLFLFLLGIFIFQVRIWKLLKYVRNFSVIIFLL